MSIQSARKVALRAVSVILRIPGLFIAEAWYRTDPVTIKHQYTNLAKENVEHPHELVFYFMYYTALLLSFTLIILPLKRLVHLYMYLASIALIVAAHFLSGYYVDLEKDAPEDVSVFENRERVRYLGLFLVAQGTITSIIAYLIDLRNSKKILLLLLYTAPMIARVAHISNKELSRVHNFSTFAAVLLVVFFIFNNIPVLLDLVKDAIRQLTVAVHLYGWIPFLVAMWFKILLPMQFLMFWCVLFGLQLYKYLGVASHPIMAEGWLVVFLASIGECCVTPMSLLGLCITVSYISYLVLTLTKLFLQGRNAFVHDNVMHQGWTEGFTMFLLGIQTGIIELKSAQRAFLMSIVLFIVVSSLIQSMFEITDPILLSLGASQNKNLMKHVRAVALCTFLWAAPLYMTVVICQFFELDFWLMVVISSCILTSVQVIGSLVIYALFIYDAVQVQAWENLDDVVYYAKATTRVLEFIVALFVVCYGVNESIFGEWSFVNSSILFIHCYFNVWQRLQSGWKTYLLRREAAKKIHSLPDASPEQLLQHNDLCSICFQELATAKVTQCKHYFHGTCLRKWLYVQDYCPLCHKTLTLGPSSPDTGSEGAEGEHTERNAGAPEQPQEPGQPEPDAADPGNGVEAPAEDGSANIPPQAGARCLDDHNANSDHSRSSSNTSTSADEGSHSCNECHNTAAGPCSNCSRDAQMDNHSNNCQPSGSAGSNGPDPRPNLANSSVHGQSAAKHQMSKIS